VHYDWSNKAETLYEQGTTVPQIQNQHFGIVWCREKRFSLRFKARNEDEDEGVFCELRKQQFLESLARDLADMFGRLFFCEVLHPSSS
jgi:hypothetical protein